MSKKYEVLDIGSGHNPYEKADVLCERYLENLERVGDVKIDRPFVIGDLEYLPFKDKSFDLIKCSHVLEHVENPNKALNEIKRVGKSAYITTPSWIAENYMYRRRYHKSIVMSSFGRVYTIRNKYFNREKARGGERQAREVSSAIISIKRFLKGVKLSNILVSKINKYTRLLTTVISINGGTKIILFKEKNGLLEKMRGLWFIIFGGVIQQIRDTLLYLYYLKKKEETLDIWKI